MPIITGFEHLNTVELTCKKCKGKCWNSNQSKRQAAVIATFGGPLPNKCVSSQLDGAKCPYRQ